VKKVYLKSLCGIADEISNPTYFNNLVVANIIVMENAKLIPYRYYVRIISRNCAEHIAEERNETLEKYLVLKEYDEKEITKHVNKIIDKCKNKNPKKIISFLDEQLISEEAIYWQ
jgi:hypothetical protein